MKPRFPTDPNPNTRAFDNAHRASTGSSASYVRAKNTTCGKCRKTYYTSLGACPFCPPPAPFPVSPSAAPTQTPPPPSTAVVPAATSSSDFGRDALAETGEGESLLAGSGSHRYANPGTTDWLDQGRPDSDPR